MIFFLIIEEEFHLIIQISIYIVLDTKELKSSILSPKYETLAFSDVSKLIICTCQTHEYLMKTGILISQLPTQIALSTLIGQAIFTLEIYIVVINNAFKLTKVCILVYAWIEHIFYGRGHGNINRFFIRK